MCGICGFTGASDSVQDWATLKAMCDVMAHRGPDGEGRYIADGVALGHRRLALVDLQGGGQPMVRESSAGAADAWTPAVAFRHVRGQAAHVASDAASGGRGAFRRGKWSIAFNGEIYNYRELRDELCALGFEFQTDSDTEVLLVGYIAWSEDVLRRLRGMFAFAIYDADERELFCARDPFGIKPFYYAQQGGRFVFASEAKSILEHPACGRELNEAALAQYLCFQFSALHETFFKGVFKLPPGHFLRVRDGVAQQPECYWRPGYSPDEGVPIAQAVDAVEQAMRDSVRFHNVADVEVGSFLSSGIDSSYLAALLARENPAIKTFTVGFAEHEGDRDEVSWARELAGMLHVENDSRHIGEDEFWEVLPRVQWHMDEPSADPSAVALYFVDQLAAARVKAVLSGEGADEFFGGYRVYQAALASERMGAVPKPLLRAGSKALRAAGKRGANFLERASEQVEDWYYTNANGVAFLPAERDRILSAEVRDRLWDVRWPGGARQAVGLFPQGAAAAALSGIPLPQQLTASVYAEVSQLEQPARMQHVDLWFWLVGDILLKTDKMSMAHSLESRVPFLDREVFRVASSLPQSLKVGETQTKIALREAAERTIPRNWAQKEKLGFPVPLAAWLRSDRRYNQVKQAFESEIATRYFNANELARLLDSHRASKADNSRRIWIIYSFLVWHEAFFGGRVEGTGA